MPPKRKADAVAGGIPPWSEVNGYFSSMSQWDLLVLLSKAWDSKDDMRKTLVKGIGDAWVAADDQEAMFKFDWDLSNEAKSYIQPKTIEFKSRAKQPKEKIRLPGDGWSLTVADLRASENEDGTAFRCEDDEMGCEECGAPGSNISVGLETNRAGKQRLNIRAEVYCSCMTPYGQPDCADWTEAIYYPKGENVGNKTSDRAKAAKKK